MQHSLSDLKQMQSLSLESKVALGNRRIDGFQNKYETYCSISGGKDSEVLRHLCKKRDKNILGVYVRNGMEYPEVTEQALSHTNMIVLNPVMDHRSVLIKFGYPVISKDVSKIIYGARHSKDKKQNYLNRLDGINDDGTYSEFRQMYKKYKFLLDAPFEISNRCCYYMKEKPCQDFEKETGLKPFVGTMADESQQRLNAWLKTGCNAFSGNRPMSKPLSVWTEQDILHYLTEHHDEMLESLKDEMREIGVSEEKIAEKKHPWATVYGEIVPKLDKKQVEGQMDMFDLFNMMNDIPLTTTGCDRTGCVFCLYGANCQGDQRLVRLKETHPEYYDYMMRGGKFNEDHMWIPDKGLGMKFVIDWMNKKGGLDIQY